MKFEFDFYACSADLVAQAMLGKVLLFKDNEVLRQGRIVETEAYLGQQDLALHTSKVEQSARKLCLAQLLMVMLILFAACSICLILLQIKNALPMLYS